MDWKDLFYYSESSPTGLRWATDIHNSLGRKTARGCVGEIAGTSTGSSAARVGIDGEYILCHIIIWEIRFGKIPDDMFIDHFDRNEGNNLLSNLRMVTRAVNNRNKGMYDNNTSGVTGVKVSDGNWIAQCSINGKRKQKYFSIHKYGNAEAFRLACEYRAKMIESLNAQGAGYTEDHGKRESH